LPISEKQLEPRETMNRYSIVNWDKGVFAEFETREQAVQFRLDHQDIFKHCPARPVLQLCPSKVECGVIHEIGVENEPGV